MIPVNESNSKVVDINSSKYKTYFAMELRYLRDEKVIEEILSKADNIFKVYNNPKKKDYEFFHKLCCNFTLLEEKRKNYNKDEKK